VRLTGVWLLDSSWQQRVVTVVRPGATIGSVLYQFFGSENMTGFSEQHPRHFIVTKQGQFA